MFFDGKFGVGLISIVTKLIHNFNEIITKQCPQGKKKINQHKKKLKFRCKKNERFMKVYKTEITVIR